MPLAGYLAAHFVDKPAFAALCGLSVPRLNELIAMGAVPDASYTTDGASIQSVVFGRTEFAGAPVGEFFRPECVRWTRIANEAGAGLERSAVLAALRAELREALAELPDPAAPQSADAMDARIEDYLPHFFNGTFALCVADPSNGRGIARKEVFQERLARLTANASNPQPEGISRQALLELIDDFAESAMPFSPAEYSRSSRKRLVEDLRPLVASGSA